MLLFVGAAIGWTIAPLEHLRPTPQNVAAGAATFIVGLLIVRWRWGSRHVVRWSSTVVPEFEPPAGLRPAEADVLLHGKPRRRDVTATVVDLALRDFVRIEERSEGDGTPTWVFERSDAPIGQLREYERKTLAGLFAYGPTVTLAALEPRFFVVADLVEDELESDVVRRGWFADRPARLRSRWATAGWVTALAGIPVTFALGNAFALGLAGAAVSAVGIVVCEQDSLGSSASSTLRDHRRSETSRAALASRLQDLGTSGGVPLGASRCPGACTTSAPRER